MLCVVTYSVVGHIDRNEGIVKVSWWQYCLSPAYLPVCRRIKHRNYVLDEAGIL